MNIFYECSCLYKQAVPGRKCSLAHAAHSPAGVVGKFSFWALIHFFICSHAFFVSSFFHYFDTTARSQRTVERRIPPFNVILYFPLSRCFRMHCYVIRKENFLEAVLMMFEKPLQCISSNFMKILNFPVGRDCWIPVLVYFASILNLWSFNFLKVVVFKKSVQWFLYSGNFQTPSTSTRKIVRRKTLKCNQRMCF